MYVKLTNGQPNQFPYTIDQLRRDNPQTSFPKAIPDWMLRENGVHPVKQTTKPKYDPLVQTLKQDEMPHKEVTRLKTKEDATHPFTGEVDQSQVGQPVYGNRWLIGWTVENKPQEDAEAAVRKKRNTLLEETDWTALSDTTLTPEMAAYRQALRDITNQAGFPYGVDWPTKP